MKNQLFLIAMCLMLSACAGRTVKVLDATWVSMKHPMPPTSKDKLVKVGSISEEYCVKSWSGSFGLMDEVVKQAEAKQQVDYVKYPSFTQTVGQPCVQLSGEGYRVTN
jgi:hypothetical protein